MNLIVISKHFDKIGDKVFFLIFSTIHWNKIELQIHCSVTVLFGNLFYFIITLRNFI